MIVSHHGVRVRLPKGRRSLTDTQRGHLEQAIGDRKVSKAASCVVFFPASRRGGAPGSMPVQRCEGKHLSTSAKSRYTAQRRAGDICQSKRTGQFTTRCG